MIELTQLGDRMQPMSAAVSLQDPWELRPYAPETDETAMLYMLGVGYTRSRAGIRAGASRAGGNDPPEQAADGTMVKPPPPSTDDIAKQRAFIDAHRPVWKWLLDHADVTLVVDREMPSVIWAWLVSSDDVVHAVGCKRSFTTRRRNDPPPISVDIVSAMLGDRLTRHQVCSLELPQMRTRGPGAIGIDRPREWSLDPTWLLVHMGVR